MKYSIIHKYDSPFEYCKKVHLYSAFKYNTLNLVVYDFYILEIFIKQNYVYIDIIILLCHNI